MTMCALVVAVVLTAFGSPSPAQSYKQTAPESFRANAQATEGVAGVAAAFTFRIDAYTPDADRESVLKALTTDGAAFLTALKGAPAAGFVQAGDRKVTIRWARQQVTSGGGRHVVLVTDAPIYFVGGGAQDAKPKAGYDVAVIQFDVDTVGLGSGTMAAAAKVKPGGSAGVQVDDYAQAPIKLVTVTRNAS